MNLSIEKTNIGIALKLPVWGHGEEGLFVMITHNEAKELMKLLKEQYGG